MIALDRSKPLICRSPAPRPRSLDELLEPLEQRKSRSACAPLCHNHLVKMICLRSCCGTLCSILSNVLVFSNQPRIVELYCSSLNSCMMLQHD